MTRTHTPLMLVGLLAPTMRLGSGALQKQEARGFMVFAVLFALLLACYLPYLQFETWTYLRFLLPAFPLLIVLTVVVFRRLFTRLLPITATTGLVAATSLLVVLGFGQAGSRTSFNIANVESRYREIARWASEQVSDDTVLFAMQHSGSLSYYTELPVARYDEIGERMDDFVRHLAGSGYSVTLVIDEWERDRIRESYESGSVLAGLDWTPTTVVNGVLAYDLSDRLREIGQTP